MKFFKRKVKPTSDGTTLNIKKKHEELACKARDIIVGEKEQCDCVNTIKALQRPSTMGKVLSILRNMPEPPNKDNPNITENPSIKPSTAAYVTYNDLTGTVRPHALYQAGLTSTSLHSQTSSKNIQTEVTDSAEILPGFELPAKDALSIFTYWWGYELYVPNHVVIRIVKEGNMAAAVASLIAATATAVPPLVPFVRLIAGFITLELTAIQGRDKGTGLILSASWLLPALLIPRPWK
ncbi:hypothetical protein K7432_011590 [Basidiobolus ranarum]|uniref:Uncharacterized protein n=1 Tax=Basidiobolus ranarum TaxID=34480 RepID=A0ABR2VTP5_9FUNG